MKPEQTDPKPVSTLPSFDSQSRYASLTESDKQAIIDEVGEARNQNKLKSNCYLDVTWWELLDI